MRVKQAGALRGDDAELLALRVHARAHVREEAGKVHEDRVLAGALLEGAHEHRQHGHLELDEAVVRRAEPRLLVQGAASSPSRPTPRARSSSRQTTRSFFLMSGTRAIVVGERLEQDVLEDVEDHALADGVLHEHLQRVVVVVRRQEPDDPVRRERLRAPGRGRCRRRARGARAPAWPGAGRSARPRGSLPHTGTYRSRRQSPRRRAPARG